LSWQGDGNTRADFPGATSIWDGIKAAVTAGGGSAQLSPDGSFTQKPDVAIVVFGEKPYAEMRGDIHTLEFSPARRMRWPCSRS
jgi:beta-glucosidase